jgi:hypothetical protein
VTKLSTTGNSLVYSTYLGGSSDECGHSIAVDGAGSAYVAGETKSSDFPTATSFEGSLNGYSDAFVTKLNPAGTSLVYSSYLGGSSDEYGNGIVVDGAGSAYVIGWTWSPDFPLANPFASMLNGYSDAFVTKLNSAATSLVYSTYLGGNGGDDGDGIAVDESGNAYVTGWTYSSDFPTQNHYDSGFNGVYDAFVTKLSPSGCCIGRVGDANGQGTYPDEITLGDIMMIVDAKFISESCDKIACLTEADVNQSGGSVPTCDDITLGDIMILVDFMFINPETATLPECL